MSMMKYIVLVLALPMNAVAELTKTDLCQQYAAMSEISAEGRDKGVSQDVMEGWARTEAQDEISKEIALLAVARVHRYPRLSPREEGNAAYNDCVENWGE